MFLRFMNITTYQGLDVWKRCGLLRHGEAEAAASGESASSIKIVAQIICRPLPCLTFPSVFLRRVRLTKYRIACRVARAYAARVEGGATVEQADAGSEPVGLLDCFIGR